MCSDLGTRSMRASMHGHVHHLYPLPLHQRQEAFQRATARVHDELGQSADDQGGVCPIGAVNQD